MTQYGGAQGSGSHTPEAELFPVLGKIIFGQLRLLHFQTKPHLTPFLHHSNNLLRRPPFANEISTRLTIIH